MNAENINEFDNDFEEDNNLNDSPIERYQINTFTQDRAIETLLKWYKNNKLILPEFQRDYVWTYSNSCRLIESILLNLPLPNIFLFKIKDKNGDKFMLIDGLQRITTINQYVDGEWKQGDKNRKFKLQSPNVKWDKKMFKDLSVDDQQFLFDYPIGTTIFESSSGEGVDQNNVVFSVFERINTGSEKLSDQEIRNAIYDGELLSRLKETATNKDYFCLIEQDATMQKRGKDIEFLLRLITYKHIYERTKLGFRTFVDAKPKEDQSYITTSKKIMLNNYMYWSNNGRIDFKEDIREVLEAISCIANFDISAFCGKAKDSDAISLKVHELFAEALVLAVINNEHNISIDKESFIKSKLNLWMNENAIEPFKYKTTAPNTVVNRVEYVLKMIRG